MPETIPRTATSIQFLIHKRVPGTSIYPRDEKVTIAAPKVIERKFLKMPGVMTPIGYFSGNPSKLHVLDGASAVVERSSAYSRLEKVLGRDSVAALAKVPGFDPEMTLDKMGVSAESEDSDAKEAISVGSVDPGTSRSISPELIDAFGHDIASLLDSKGFSSKSEVVGIKPASVAKTLGLNVKDDADAEVRDTVVSYIKAA